MIRRTNQGGSVASFVIISVILAVGLLASIYFLNLRGQQARKEQTTAANNKTQTPKPEATGTTNTSTTTSKSSKTKSQATDLPATGVETSITSLASVFLLSASIVAYLTSRRVQQHSL